MPTNPLDDRYALYCDLIKTRQDRHGFIPEFACDQTLFSGLAGCVPGVHVDIWAAFDPATGRWHRRPIDSAPCCYPDESNSTISRDMLIGVAWFAWARKDLAMSESVVTYALKHALKMGDGDPAATFISPGLLATFAWISYRLGGPSRAWLRWIKPTSTAPTLTGYQRHLQLLHLALRDRLEGREDVKTLAYNYYKQDTNDHDNALTALLTGWWLIAESALLNCFPATRLPNSWDHKAPWLWERDFGADWRPAVDSPMKTHSGADFLFVYALLRGWI